MQRTFTQAYYEGGNIIIKCKDDNLTYNWDYVNYDDCWVDAK